MNTTNNNPLKSLRVLIVNDVNLNNSTLGAQLEPAGIKPLLTPHASQALTVLKQSQLRGISIPIVICSYNMVDMNGLEFIRKLRQEPTIKGTHVILLANGDIGHAMVELQALNVHQIFNAPCSTATLLGAIAEHVPCADETNVRTASKVATVDKKSIRILAADDDAINLAVLKGFLNLSGYNVETVNDGVEAVSAFKNTNYDLILMDISMPRMDGVDATLSIREIERQFGKNPVPIVAVTGHIAPNQKKRYIQSGMNDVIAKPITKKVMDDCLNMWCARLSQNPETAKTTASIG